MDLLLFALIAIVGWALQRKPKQKQDQQRKAQPRREVAQRQQQQQADPNAPTPTAGGRQGHELESMFKRFFGMEEEKDPVEVRKEQEAAKRREEARRDHAMREAARKQAARHEAVEQEATRKIDAQRQRVLREEQVISDAASQRREMISLSRHSQAGSSAATSAGASGSLATYKPQLEHQGQAQRGQPTSAAKAARNLRNNPNAAKEAFVYAEVFGPPVADRM